MLDNFSDILASQKMYELLGPGAAERWLYWRSRTREQVSVSFNCGEKRVFLSPFTLNTFCEIFFVNYIHWFL